MNKKVQLILYIMLAFVISNSDDSNAKTLDNKSTHLDSSENEYNSLNNDLKIIGKKYNLSQDTMNDILSDVSDNDSNSDNNDKNISQKNSNMVKSETQFMENSRIQSIPLKDIEQLKMINNNHENSIPFSVVTMRIDAYRLNGDKESVNKQIDILKTTSSLKEFKDNILSLNNFKVIAEKKYFPIVLNNEGYITEPSSFEMINSRSFFNDETKTIENKPYGYAFYVNSPKDSSIKTLLGVYDNPCEFIEHSHPICYQNYILEDISDRKEGVLTSTYNDMSNTQMIIHYQTTKKIIP